MNDRSKSGATLSHWVVFLLSAAISATVVLYLATVAYYENYAPKLLPFVDDAIPKETHAILLMALFTASQRASAHWSPFHEGASKLLSRLDFIISLVVFAAIVAIMVYTYWMGKNKTFAIVLITFALIAFFDVVMNARHMMGVDHEEGAQVFRPTADGAGNKYVGNMTFNCAPGTSFEVTVTDEGAVAKGIAPAVEPHRES